MKDIQNGGGNNDSKLDQIIESCNRIESVINPNIDLEDLLDRYSVFTSSSNLGDKKIYFKAIDYTLDDKYKHKLELRVKEEAQQADGKSYLKLELSLPSDVGSFETGSLYCIKFLAKTDTSLDTKIFILNTGSSTNDGIIKFNTNSTKTDTDDYIFEDKKIGFQFDKNHQPIDEYLVYAYRMVDVEGNDIKLANIVTLTKFQQLKEEPDGEEPDDEKYFSLTTNMLIYTGYIDDPNYFKGGPKNVHDAKKSDIIPLKSFPQYMHYTMMMYNIFVDSKGYKRCHNQTNGLFKITEKENQGIFKNIVSLSKESLLLYTLSFSRSISIVPWTYRFV